MIEHIPHQLFKQTKHPSNVDDYWHVFNLSNCLNVLYWVQFFEMVRQVEGDIVECGVGRGRSLITMLALESYYSTTNHYPDRHLFALDSFEGFPEPHLNDRSPRNPKKGEWSASPNGQFSYSVENLKTILNNAEIPAQTLDRLSIHKGFFSDTAPELGVKKIAILHLDGDLYESVRDPLVYLWERVSVGGVVVIDDYLLDDADAGNESFPGARKAIEEFLADNPCFTLNRSVRGTPYLIRSR